MNISSLIDAVGGVGLSPCDKFACAKRAQCSEQLMACSAFRHFVDTGRSCDPCIVFPARITQKQRPIHMREPMPSRDIFISMDDEPERRMTPVGC